MKTKVTWLVLVLMLSAPGCSGRFWGGAATGAIAGGGGYEINLKRQMDRIEEDYKAGRIDQEEYEIRKDQIQRDSLIQ